MPTTAGKKIKKYSIVMFILLFLASSKSFADIIDDLDKQITDQQKQLEDLVKQKEAYLAAIKVVQENADTLANEISLLDNQILALENDIASYETDIQKTELEIQKIGLEIDEKKKKILVQKEALKSILQTIDSYDNKSALEIVLSNDKLSGFLDEVFYTETVQSDIQDLVNKIRVDKENLEKDKIDETAKKNKLESLKAMLESKKLALAAEEDAKKQLLDKTRGEEKRYQKLLGDIVSQREQILGDIEELRQQKAAELEKIKAQLAKPKENLTADSWYYSQTDPKWADTAIGLSTDSTMKDYGCAVASLAMLFKYHNIDIDPGVLARQPIFYYDLIVWPKVWRFLDLILNTAHSGVDWNRVDEELKNGHPVIVFIRADKKHAGHYVVIFAKDEKDYIVNDPMPWDGTSGANMYLSSTRAYLGKIYDTTTTVDQMIVYH